jgi:hypothetical protein
MKNIVGLMVAFGLVAIPFEPVVAEQTYLVGHIRDITFVRDAVYIMLDTGVPGNCTGTPYGWMVIRGSDKAMQGFVLGLKFSGAFSSTTVAVYTDGIGSSSYCEINQIDPAE